MAEHENCIQQRPDISALDYRSPGWIEPSFEEASISAPTIHAGLTSVEVRTGLWRTMRPVIEYSRCNRCWWICSSACPHNVINVDDNTPVIDYDHCVGCLVCVAECPPHAIEAISEVEAETKQPIEQS